MPNGKIHSTIVEGIATITVDRPEALNALSVEMLDALDEAFKTLGQDPFLRAVIVTGAGKAFVAGGDIKVMAGLDPDQARAFALHGQRVFDLIAAFPRPVIAAINGFALGGGCELALACDFRIASATARVGQPEVGLGVIPGFGGTQRLTRLLGRSAAKYLLFTGEIVGAERALHLGLFDEVVAPENLMNRCLEIAKTIAAKAPIAVSLCKQAVDLGSETTLASGLNYEADLFAQTFATADRKEGMEAFIEKRNARFLGH